jgi:hypothetical protein
MLRLYAATAAALFAIAGFTYWESIYSDRWVTSNVTAEDFGKRFSNVPMTVGPWVGSEMKAEKATLEMAGAVSHVSRRYVNAETNQSVDLWLIVGHARDICRHTPDICYPSQGYAQIGTRVKHRIEPTGDSEHPATFFTAKFRNESAAGGHIERVFWAWNGNEPGKDQWEAPEYQKQFYGNNRALYKMYFTAQMVDADEDIPQNVAVDFAKLMIPEINKALFHERYKSEAPAADSTSDSASAEPAAAVDAETALPSVPTPTTDDAAVATPPAEAATPADPATEPAAAK